MALGEGARMAAAMVQYLQPAKQPEHLILISPRGFDSTKSGTVYPAIMPPWQPASRLFCFSFPDDQEKDQFPCSEYVKIWIGFGGSAEMFREADWTVRLTAFLGNTPAPATNAANPAAIPVEGYSPQRHAEKLQLVKQHQYDLVLLGNSITNNFEKPEYQPVWQQFFAPRNALNLGYSGYRTENILWNIQHGELDGQHPKLVVLEIGTNNIDEKNYPTRHTAEQLAGGIKAIVFAIREKLPETKIMVLRCFPGNYGGPNPTSHRVILERAAEIVSGIADNRYIFYEDVNHVFLHLDGSINPEMMPDWLHPGPAGALAWARAMEPTVARLMGDQLRDTLLPANSAVIPAEKLEEDSYNWYDRHAEVLRIKDSIDPQVVMLGNSITHFWGGLPAVRNADGSLRKPNGPRAWASLFDGKRVLNLGFGWDRTQNLLWRLDHGEIDRLHPQKIVILIGTNNTSETAHARMNSAEEIVAGIKAICERIRSKIPGADIILMAILPREEMPDHPRRLLINETNRLLADFARRNNLQLVDIGQKLLLPDGRFPRTMAPDFCHPTEKGYQVWADAIRPLLTVQ